MLVRELEPVDVDLHILAVGRRAPLIEPQIHARVLSAGLRDALSERMLRDDLAGIARRGAQPHPAL